MIVPSTSDVVQTIAKQFDEVIVPALVGLRERSCATTMSHLLRHVHQRVELEGPILFEEAGELRRVLSGVVDKLDTAAGLEGTIAEVRVALAQERDPAVYPSAALLSTEVGRLRGAVDALLVALRALPESDRAKDPVASAHGELRAYIGFQIRQEAKIVEPSFIGFGARR